MSELVCEVRNERHLRDVLDDDRVVGQGIANGRDVRQLRLEVGDVVEELGTARAELGSPVGSLQVAEPVDQQRHHFRCVTVDAERADAVPIELVEVGVDLDQVHAGVPHCSSGNSIREPMPSTRSTSGHIAMGETQRHEQWIGLVHHAVTHSSRRHRGLQQFSELTNRR